MAALNALSANIRRVLIAHNPAGNQDDPSTSDVLAQVALVEDALAELGLPAVRAAAGDAESLAALRTKALAMPGTVVFNLMEAPAGSPYLHPGSAASLEIAGIPFTGSPASTLWLTTDKIATRAVLAAEALPVPSGGRLDLADPEVLDHVLARVPPPWILKPAWEDASVGIEGNPVCANREEALELAARLAERFPREPILAERFLPGRELNVSLLADPERPGGVEVLPVAEILFQDFPAGLPRVVGYEAKWLEDSFAYIHTVRAFLDDPRDAPLEERIRRMAKRAWSACGLAGYARIDLRLDEDGEPYILEVNANPCLAADAGFMAAADRAGLTPRQVVQRILAAAVRCEPVENAVSPSAPRTPNPAVAVRRGLTPADRAPLDELIRATGFFNPEEIDIALELVDDRLAQGEASHYRFLVAEVAGNVAGYACWGAILGTQASADLYWIAVHPREQGKKVGAALLQAAEDWMASEGRTRVYVETATRVQYLPTRRFYLACGYDLTAELGDFYAPGDGKAIFLKVLRNLSMVIV